MHGAAADAGRWVGSWTCEDDNRERVPVYDPQEGRGVRVLVPVLGRGSGASVQAQHRRQGLCEFARDVPAHHLDPRRADGAHTHLGGGGPRIRTEPRPVGPQEQRTGAVTCRTTLQGRSDAPHACLRVNLFNECPQEQSSVLAPQARAVPASSESLPMEAPAPKDHACCCIRDFASTQHRQGVRHI